MAYWLKNAETMVDEIRYQAEQGTDVYDEDLVNRSIVLGRYELVGIFSLLHSVNDQLRHTRSLLLIIMVLVAVGLWRVW
tara:strand:- start:422 stop:658 length:237 start_codon:yes stop_codon:yes gene_type:complete